MKQFTGLYQDIQNVLIDLKKVHVTFWEGNCITNKYVEVSEELLADSKLEKFIQCLEETWQNEDSQFVITFELKKLKRRICICIEFVGPAPKCDMDFDAFIELNKEEDDTQICECCGEVVSNTKIAGCCRDGECPSKIEIVCMDCGTWKEEEEKWYCPYCNQ